MAREPINRDSHNRNSQEQRNSNPRNMAAQRKPAPAKAAKEEYTINVSGTIIDGVEYKQGDTVKLDLDTAKTNQERGVSLTKKVSD